MIIENTLKEIITLNFSTRLKELRKSKHITQVGFAEIMETATSTVAMWETSQRTPPPSVMVKIAEYFNVTVDYLLGVDDKPNPLESEEVVMFPVLVGVKAGFGHAIEEMDNGEFQAIPRSLIKNQSQEDYLVFLVEGDSMSPKFLDGDRVLVSRQPSVDSGNIAIVAYEDFENGTIKKVHYEPGCDYVDLIPLNPKYNPIRIQGSALEGVRVIGKVIYLFREI